MTSNKDDLEQALQENLILRRELGGAAGKARSGMAYRLGWALFGACLALIAAGLFFFLM